jgi:hypothetical protein
MSEDTTVDLFEDFAVDDTKESEGVWETYKGDVKFLIARAHNPAYDRQISSQIKKHDRLIRSGTQAADEKSEEILVDVMAKTVLLNWSGPVVIKGEAVGEYSVAKAKKLLAIKAFRQWVASISEDFGRFKAVQEEEEEGK